MVCEYSVVIESIGYDTYDPERRRNVERLGAAERYIGRLPLWSAGRIWSKTAR